MDETIESLREKLAEQQAEFEEFQEDSNALEKELESELRESRADYAQLRDKATRLASDLRQLQLEHERLGGLHAQQTERGKELTAKLRNLEQCNDAVDRGRREADSTADHLGTKLNEALERIVLLEQELADARRDFMEYEQRSKEIVRDLESDVRRLNLELDKRVVMIHQPSVAHQRSRRRAPDVGGLVDDSVTYGQAPGSNSRPARRRRPTLEDVCMLFCMWLGCKEYTKERVHLLAGDE